MAFTSNSIDMSTSQTSILVPKTHRFPFRKRLRNWEVSANRRRRLKLNQKLIIRSELNPPPLSHFEEFFQNIISSLPIPLTSQNFFPPAALGIASGLAFSFSKMASKTKNSNSQVCDIGEWILFTSPTPFNRFVLLRCPTITFEGGEFQENVNDKLVKEERHYVRLDSGIIQERTAGDNRVAEKQQLEYQRFCVGTDDGGVISLDWPCNLDLSDERGLDTTFLLIPGTAEGSMDENVRAFVSECLKRGFFPVVMNPRGCAGSPLTTPRLFTAADSDDIRSAIKFLNRERPWSTLMGVGWGFGANMLTKYLAEVGEKTPLTAVTCIGNPFDLEEATRISAQNSLYDQKLTAGLRKIVESNKELFQGRSKKFDVEKALSAKSIRDFDEAISMVSYGFDNIEEFYLRSSTRTTVGDLKIPALFIQNNNGEVPLFSIPRGTIAQNQYASLLLCSCLPSDIIASSRSITSWCQQLTIEWLTAVELGLLKGRHPLLQDVDVTVKPSKSLALVEGGTPKAVDPVNNVLTFSQPGISNSFYLDPIKDLPDGSDSNDVLNVPPGGVSDSKLKMDDKDLRLLNHASSLIVDADMDDVANQEDVDRGQVLQTAQVVMNMLDVTMPGTLQEEKKKKVLDAVGQGETLAKALQDAVPEDVRGKLTDSVSEILQAQGKSLKFYGPARIGQKSDASSGLKVETGKEVKKQLGSQTNQPSNMERTASDVGDGLVNKEASGDIMASVHEKPLSHLESSVRQDKNYVDGQAGQLDDIDESNVSGRDERVQDSSSVNPVDKHDDSGTGELRSKDGSDMPGKVEMRQESSGFTRDIRPVEGETGQLSKMSGRQERQQGTSGSKLDMTNEDGTTTQLDTKDEGSTTERNEKGHESSESQNKANSPTSSVDAVSPSNTSDVQVLGKSQDGSNMDGKKAQSVPEQNNPVPDLKAPSFGLSQAFDALTGLDDSTQVAVNSVFGVIENIIDQMEEAKKDGMVTSEESNDDDDVRSKGTPKDNDSNDQQPVEAHDENHQERVQYTHNTSNVKGNIGSASGRKSLGISLEENILDCTSPIVDKLVAKDGSAERMTNKHPIYLTTNAHAEAFYNEYLHKYILSKAQKAKPLDLCATTALFLDYIPEEQKWKMIGHPTGTVDTRDIAEYKPMYRIDGADSNKKEIAEENVIEPQYTIHGSKRQLRPVGASETVEILNCEVVSNDERLDELTHVKNNVYDSLRVEVNRRVNAEDMKEMDEAIGRDIEIVALAICSAIRNDKRHSWHHIDEVVQESSTFDGEHIVKVISHAVKDTGDLKRVLPLGVIVGSCLASLRKGIIVSDLLGNDGNGPVMLEGKQFDMVNTDGRPPEAGTVQDSTIIGAQNKMVELASDADRDIVHEIPNSGNTLGNALKRDTLMVGAVTAALGASALMRHEQGSVKKKLPKESVKLKDDKHHSNIITSLAEKAMSVAAPVVPTKEGEVDQERLVSMLAELGQKGGMLKLVGKVALLWGGLRGAMSLTDRLIMFLRISERPLFYRIIAFVCMVVLLWSPVLVPLLPTILKNWAAHTSSGIADLVCIAGLYTAVTILIMLWGKRITRHENPLQQYGLDLSSRKKISGFLTGLAGGIMLILSIHSVNAFLGYAYFCLPMNVSSTSVDLIARLKAYSQLLVLAGRGIATATFVAFVEELFFRAWLPDEIAADLGYHQGIILSGLLFSLSQRSLQSVPGLWLLSLCLSGARQRDQGQLFVPIGIRSGIMVSNLLLLTGGFLKYNSEFPVWLVGTHSTHPFSGMIGVLFSLLTAIALYPRELSLRENIQRTIRE